ncbi:MAG: hypothetical protein OXL68_09715 [Paracoccaceae bacterium]|nr:hypothetical protein [Paracoccaceae bacterium]
MREQEPAGDNGLCDSVNDSRPKGMAGELKDDLRHDIERRKVFVSRS